MPTPKQVRYHYKRVMSAWYRLYAALRDAHNADVIIYEGYEGVAPCETNNQTRERFRTSTKEQLATAMHEELMKEVRGW